MRINFKVRWSNVKVTRLVTENVPYLWDVADQTGLQMKISFQFISLYLYLFAYFHAQKDGHDWRLRSSVELSHVGQWEHFYDATQLNSTGAGVLNIFAAWPVELSRVMRVFPLPDVTQLNWTTQSSVVTIFLGVEISK